MLRRDLIIPALMGVGAAALLSKAQANTPFTSFPFNATGGTSPRTMPDRLADIVNVKDYGATGNGSTDDYPAVQAALDAAFTASGSPNGVSNATKNRPVFFPNGTYNCVTGTPTINKVYGGHIYGAAMGSTIILNNFGAVPVFAINGAVGLVMERLSLVGNNSTSTFTLDLDWNNGSSNFVASGLGLRHNTFSCIAGGNAQGIRVANSGNDGANNLFQQISATSAYSGTENGPGIEFKGTSAINNLILHCGFSGNPSILCSGGSAHMVGCDFSQESNPNYDLQIDSGYPVSVIGGRAESTNFAKISNGLLTIRSFTTTSVSGILVSATGGRTTIDGTTSAGANCVGSIATATGCSISGTTLTIGTLTAGSLLVGQVLNYAGMPGLPSFSVAPFIKSNISGSGSGSTWTMNYAPGNASGLAVRFGNALYLRSYFGIGLTGYNGIVSTGDQTVQNI